MALNKALDAITEQDLQVLVNQKEPESKALDYKAMWNFAKEGSKTEFRKDVISFANSLGGDLVIGISDKKGLPEEVCGFDLDDLSPEHYRLRISEVLQSRIKPRIQGIAIRLIQLSNGKWAAIIRIPNSFTKPHQVEVGNKDFQFWFRHDAGKQRMDIDELRSSVLFTESLAERLRTFRIDRLGRITTGGAPTALADGTKAVMHLIPANAFDASVRYDLTFINKKWTLLTTMYTNSLYDIPRYNFDGIFSHDKHPQEPAANSYVQIFHSGIVESVEGRLFSHPGRKVLDSSYFEEMLLKALSKYLSVQEQLGVTPPIIIAVSLLGIDGYSLSTPDRGTPRDSERFIRENNLLTRLLH